jgi:hypothetical protein
VASKQNGTRGVVDREVFTRMWADAGAGRRGSISKLAKQLGVDPKCVTERAIRLGLYDYARRDWEDTKLILEMLANNHTIKDIMVGLGMGQHRIATLLAQYVCDNLSQWSQNHRAPDEKGLAPVERVGINPLV